jgi:nitrate/nitrite-specific signal transduction histidine kinase
MESICTRGPSLIVLEATGGDETALVAALAGAALPVVVAHPRQVRDLHPPELEVDVSLPDATANLRLDMDVRRDLFLICKEALTNAARHARCRHLRVSLRNAGGVLTLEVVDDGVGFDADQGFEGNGLVSMRRRAERIGASLSVRSQPGRGTTVRVELPLRRRARRAPTPRGR